MCCNRRPFFPKLVDFLSSGPVVAMVWEGKEVIRYGKIMRYSQTNGHCCTANMHALLHLA